MIDLDDLAARYVALWNEPDPDARRAAIAALWSADGVQHLEPPEPVRDSAASLNMVAAFTAAGHAGIEARVTRAYEEFVAPGEHVFRRAGLVQQVGNVVKLDWAMVTAGGGEPVGGGVEFIELDADGRIRRDHQFITR